MNPVVVQSVRLDVSAGLVPAMESTCAGAEAGKEQESFLLPCPPEAASKRCGSD